MKVIATSEKEILLPANLLSIPCNSSSKRDLDDLNIKLVFFVTILDESLIPGIVPSLSSVPLESTQRLFLFLHQENWRLLRIKIKDWTNRIGKSATFIMIRMGMATQETTGGTRPASLQDVAPPTL